MEDVRELTPQQDRFIQTLDATVSFLQEQGGRLVTLDQSTNDLEIEGLTHYRAVNDKARALINAAQGFRVAQSPQASPELLPKMAAHLWSLIESEDTPSELAEIYGQSYGDELRDVLGEEEAE